MWPFERKPPRRSYPFRDLKGAMRAKDPDLYEEVKMMSVKAAADRWVEVHPEDFPGGLIAIMGRDGSEVYRL